jgi:hypothetical protein
MLRGFKAPNKVLSEATITKNSDSRNSGGDDGRQRRPA